MIHVKWNLQVYRCCTNSPPLDEENRALSLIWIIFPTILHPILSRQIHQYSHTRMDPTLNKWDTTKTWWLCCFFPPITLNYIFHGSTSAPKCLRSKFLTVKIMDPLLFSCVMDNVYHGYDKLFPHKWFCHGLLLAVMWDSACRLKQP